MKEFFLSLSFFVSLYFNQYDQFALGITALFSIISGIIIKLTTKQALKTISKRDGYVIVSLVWVVFFRFGVLPFVLSDFTCIRNWRNAVVCCRSTRPTPDKLHPRIKETAKRLWIIYIGFTFAETILLKIGGMTWFDAINHSFTTMATGGYSTKQASIAHFQSPFIHKNIILVRLLIFNH
ncbi:MAG: potassium transporter TrkG [Bacteroidales bacterium]